MISLNQIDDGQKVVQYLGVVVDSMFHEQMLIDIFSHLVKYTIIHQRKFRLYLIDQILVVEQVSVVQFEIIRTYYQETIE